MPLGVRLLVTALAIGASWWAGTFVRGAVRTLRTGAPLRLRGSRAGSAPIEARFGRVGAVFVAALASGVAYMLVRVAIAAWTR